MIKFASGMPLWSASFRCKDIKKVAFVKINSLKQD